METDGGAGDVAQHHGVPPEHGHLLLSDVGLEPGGGPALAEVLLQAGETAEGETQAGPGGEEVQQQRQVGAGGVRVEPGQDLVGPELVERTGN